MKRTLTLCIGLLYVCMVHAQIRFLSVDPSTDEIYIKNFGTAAVDISSYRLCSEFIYTSSLTSGVTQVLGTPMLMPGDTLGITWPINDAAADLGLYLGTGSFGSADAMVDFMQYGAGGIGRENVANTKGIWNAGDFLAGTGPFVYTGDGTQTGLAAWESNAADPIIRFLKVDPATDEIYIKNFGSEAVDISAYRLCSEFLYTSSLTAGVTQVLGTPLLMPGDTLGIAWPINDVAADLGLYLGTGSFGSADAMVDFMQYGAGGIGRENVANTKGIWSAGDFLSSSGPYTYTGDGSEQGLSQWSGTFASDEGLYQAQLSGTQEVLPVLTTATGSVTASLSNDTLRVSGTFSGLQSRFNPAIGGGAHIHQGYAGQNGGVVWALSVSLNADSLGGTFEEAQNTFVLDSAQRALLEGRQLYVNIHTEDTPSGELRGQLLPDAEAYYTSNLLGSNAVPSVMSMGNGVLVMERTGDQLVISGSFGALEGNFREGVAHLHRGKAGQTGGVEIGLAVDPSEDLRSGILAAESNTFTLTQDQIDLLESRSLYANIHTDFSPSGELRGQVHPPADALFRAHLSGANEPQPILSTGSGEVLLELSGNTLTVSGYFNGLKSEFNANIGGGAHIHLGLAGQNGGVILPLTTDTHEDLLGGMYNASENTFELDSAQVASLLGRAYYVNIHSVGVPSGEIRGQVLPQSQLFFTGFLSGTQETNLVISQASGSVSGELLGSQLTLSGSFSGLESDLNTALAGGSHIHKAPAGANGSIALVLAIETGEDLRGGQYLPEVNTFSLSEGLVDSLKSRNLYVNIHSLENGPGEIRAQLLPEATAYFLAPLSGTNATVPVLTPGTGLVIGEYRGGKLTTTGSFGNLQGDFDPNIAGGSHIHGGFAGRNGGILFGLTPDLDGDNKGGRYQAADNTFTLSEGLTDSLFQRMMYVNIHTTEVGSGEIRGNFLPYAQAYFTTSLSGINASIPNVSGARGAMKGELTGNMLTLTGGFSGLEGNFDVDIAGGAHLHKAPVGQNGGIEVFLKALLDEDLKGGYFGADSNRVELSEAQVLMLREDSLYANLHSEAYPSGEIRGQLLGEQNFFPAASTPIILPENGARIVLQGKPEDIFTASWMMESSEDRDPTISIWQLAADSAFSTLLAQFNSGSDTTVSLEFGAIDAILAENGIEVEDSIILYHRVATSDGSVQAGGTSATVTLTRGIVTDLDPAIKAQVVVKLFPSPASEHIVLEVQLPIQGALEMEILDVAGRQMHTQKMNANPGLILESLDLSAFPTGMYVMRLKLEGEELNTIKFLRQ